MNLTTAVIIIAPHEVQQVAVPILRQYDLDDLIRVPAHITILYPFAPMEQLDAACEKLRAICAEAAPFEVTVDGYDKFPSVWFMKPADPAPIRALFRRIFAHFPECPPYHGAFGSDIHPHMTVAQFPNEAERLAALPTTAVLPAYSPITFHVSRLHVVYGIDQVALPWLTYAVIPLKSKSARDGAVGAA